MADLEVDSMTDAELRTKLAEHGFPVMPITASTRKLLVKKMKLVLSEKGKSRNSMNPKADSRASSGVLSDASKADQVDSMSDAEIQAKLSEHGYPVMPITPTTRPLFIKKVKGILEKGNSRTGVDNKMDSRHSLLRYSSGEESDLDTKAKEKRGRRQTTGGAMLPPSASKTRRATKKRSPSPVKMDTDKHDSDTDEENSPIRTHEEVETVTTRRITRTFANDDEFETGSDSDVDMDKKSTSFRNSSRSSDYISSTFPADPSPNQSPVKPSRLTRPSTSPTGLTSSFSSGLSSSDHLNSIRSRLGLTSTLGDRQSYFTSTYNTPSSSYQPAPTFQPSTSIIDEVESPYLSNFTRRLSALKPEATPKPNPFLDRDSTNGSTMLPRRSYIAGVSRPEEYKITSDKKFLKNNLVSFALLALAGLFFFFLFFMYIVKKNDITSVADDQNSVIPICQLNIPGNRPGINCVPKEQVSYAKDLLKWIHPDLTAKIAAYKCGQPNAMPYLTEREILDIASARVDTADISQCRTDLNNLQVLIVSNPRWGLSVVQLKNLYTKDAEYTPISSTDQFVQQRSKGSVAITLADPSTPLSCLFVNTLYSAGSTIIVIALLTLMALGGQKGYKLYVGYRKRKSEEIYSMVEQIIDLVYQETEDSGEPYISVDHVRDTLISAQNREKMSSTWDAAVKFIQRNESRVRMEVQSVDGEDCRVWRWLAPAHASPKRGASWQGQAFETQEGSVNNVPEAPTPCLKIRHMFDKNDTNPNLRSVLQEAILEKCGDRCNILHIDLDRASFCVYVKCATPSDASVVYRSMHGWWYEGKLITVKYLRLERYMMRFPNSPSVGPYLKPNSRSVRE